MAFLRRSLSVLLALVLTWAALHTVPAAGLGATATEAPEPIPRTQLRPVTESAVSVESIEAPEVEMQAEEPQVTEEAVEESPQELAAVEPPAMEPESTEEAVPEAAAQAPGEAAPDSPEESDAPAVAAAELGTADGDEESELREVGEDVEQASPRRTAQDLSTDASLTKLAAKELSGGQAALGFSTVLISSPEDQLDIARAFGEEVVLVPKGALAEDGQAESFQLQFRGAREPKVVAVKGRPDLERSRQYRDLFAYEFQHLPPKVRELRRAVIRRDEVFLFAALIPASEWAVVIGRRREACEHAGISEDDVDQYVLRYVRTRTGGFDFTVDELLLANGERIRSPLTSRD